jgi:hypothetical protein
VPVRPTVPERFLRYRLDRGPAPIVELFAADSRLTIPRLGPAFTGFVSDTALGRPCPRRRRSGSGSEM